MSKKIKYALIGADMRLRAAMVDRHAPADRAELVAVCDRDPEMIAAYKSTHPDTTARFYTDSGQMFKDGGFEVVFVMVRDQYHEELACKALSMGITVFLEKPMAITIEGCDRILETAYRHKAKLMVGHNMRYMPSVMKMKEVIDSGMIGEVQSAWCRHFINYGSCYFRHWCATQATCTGLLLQKGAHDIDVIHHLCSSYTTRVTAMGKLSVYNRTTDRLAPGEAPDRKLSWSPACWPPLELTKLAPVIDVEDHSMMLMQLANGVQASYEHSMYAPDSERNYTFIGTHGRVENIGDRGDCQIHVWTQRGSRQNPDVIFNLKEIEGGHGGADPRIIKGFFDFACGEAPAPFSPVAARNAVAAGYLAHYSMRNGNIPMDIPPVAPEIAAYFDNGQIG